MSTTTITKAMYFVAGAPIALGHVVMWDIQDGENIARHFPWCMPDDNGYTSGAGNGFPGTDMKDASVRDFQTRVDYGCVYDREDKHHSRDAVPIGGMNWLRYAGRPKDPASSDWNEWYYKPDDPDGQPDDAYKGANWTTPWPEWKNPKWGGPYVTAGGFGMFDVTQDSNVYEEILRDPHPNIYRNAEYVVNGDDTETATIYVGDGMISVVQFQLEQLGGIVYQMVPRGGECILKLEVAASGAQSTAPRELAKRCVDASCNTLSSNCDGLSPADTLETTVYWNRVAIPHQDPAQTRPAGKDTWTLVPSDSDKVFPWGRKEGARNARPRPVKATTSYDWSDLPAGGGKKEIAANFGTLHPGGWMKYHYCPYYDKDGNRNSDEWLTCFRYNPVKYAAENHLLGWKIERYEGQRPPDDLPFDTWAGLVAHLTENGTQKLWIKRFAGQRANITVDDDQKPIGDNAYATVAVSGGVLTFSNKSYNFHSIVGADVATMTQTQFDELGLDKRFYWYQRLLDRGFGWINPQKLGWKGGDPDKPYGAPNAVYKFIVEVSPDMMIDCANGCTFCMRWDNGGGGVSFSTAQTFTSCVDVFTGDSQPPLPDGDSPGCRCGQGNGAACPAGPSASDNCGYPLTALDTDEGAGCLYDNDPWSCTNSDGTLNLDMYPFGYGCGASKTKAECREPDCTNDLDCLPEGLEDWPLVDCGAPPPLDGGQTECRWPQIQECLGFIKAHSELCNDGSGCPTSGCPWTPVPPEDCAGGFSRFSCTDRSKDGHCEF